MNVNDKYVCPWCGVEHYFENDEYWCSLKPKPTVIELAEDSDISNPPDWFEDTRVLYNKNDPNASWSLPK